MSGTVSCAKYALYLTFPYHVAVPPLCSDGLPGGRGPSLDAYMAHSDDDSCKFAMSGIL